MTIAPSRPARALRGAAVVLTVLLAIRLPVMKAHFDAAVRAGTGREHAARDGAQVAITRHADGGGRPAAMPAAMAAAMRAATGAALTPPDAGPRATESGQRRVARIDLARADAPAAAPRTGPDTTALLTDVLPTTPADAPTASSGAARPPRFAAAPIALPAPNDPDAHTQAPPAASNTGGAHTAPPPAASDPGALATAAYARLAAGDRRGAVRLFDAALVATDPRASTWRRQRDALTRRWSGSAYSIVRASGPAGLATEPVLGGGQSGGALAFAPDPLSPRPIALTVRGSAGHDDAGRSAFASVGVEWRPVAGVTLAAERRVAVGPAAHGDWALRLAAGAERTRGRLHVTAYGEGGVVGAATYAALQARIAGLVHDGAVTFEPGVGGWASLQHDHATVDRIDLGPGVVVRAGKLALEVDYRARVAGNAAPGSGPVATLSAAF